MEVFGFSVVVVVVDVVVVVVLVVTVGRGSRTSAGSTPSSLSDTTGVGKNGISPFTNISRYASRSANLKVSEDLCC